MSRNSFLKLLQLFIISSKISRGIGVAFQDDIPPLNISYQLLTISHAMYDIKSINSTSIPSFLTPATFIESVLDVELLIASNDKDGYIVVAFRGTTGLRDHYVNYAGQAALTNYGPKKGHIREAGTVHMGLNNAIFNTGLYDRIEVDVMDLLVFHPTYDIYFTGHSQGGAYALLSAPMLALSNPSSNITVLNFGQPRCTKQKFKDWSRAILNLAVWNFVLRNDPVPRSPKTVRGYRHSGHLIQMQDDGSTLYYLYDSGDKNYSSIPTNWEDEFGTKRYDHMSDKYIEFFETKVLPMPEQYYVSDFARV